MPRAGKLAVCTLALSLAACTVGPDFHRPQAPAVTSFIKQPLPDHTASAPVAGGEAQRFIPGEDIPEAWWRLFHSEALNSLIEQSLRANPDLQSARAALRVAMEYVETQRGQYFPQITGGFGVTRGRDASQISPTLASSARLYTLYQAQLGASWTVDVFGGNRRQVEALQAQADAERYQLEAILVALSANVVVAAVQEASLRAQIAGTNEVIASERNALEIMQRQRHAGQISGAAVAAQEAALAQAEQTLAPLEKVLYQQRDLLTALAGRYSAEEVDQTFDLASLQLPEELPVSLPAQFVEQRPDIKVAEENLHAASAQIGVAVAARLPNITLAASDGTIATTLGQLFQPGNAFWTVGASLLQPLFDGGTLLHRNRAAVAAYDEEAANYRKAVIAAFQQVADTLHAVQTDADALSAAVATEKAAERSLDIARKQLELGQIAYLGLLTSQQTYQQALLNRVQMQANRFADTAVLFQALGGGWWNQSNSDLAAIAEQPK